MYIIMRQVPNGCCLDLNLMTNTVLQQTIFRCFQMKFFQHIQILFEHREPMYIVTGRNVQIQNQIVQTYLEKDYTELYTNNIYTLYQKIP